MATNHRKKLPEKDSHHKKFCSHCDPTCPSDCVPFYWPPETPRLPPPPSSNNDTATTLISPYLIVVVALIATAILFISYYLIMIRYCARFRRLSATQVNEESPVFSGEDHQPEIDNPIWYITTLGLQPPVINSIKVVKFKKGDSLINYTNCSVCLSEFQDNESIRLLPKCKHAFHIPCIDTWLRSHTNCPLCRASVVNNNSNTMLRSNDQNRNHVFGLSHNSQMENGDYGHGGLGSSHVQDQCETHEHRREMGNVVDVEDGKEVQDSKQEIEAMITLRRSISMDSAAEIVLMDSNSSDSSIEMQSLNHLRDSRSGRMVMMVRSFSFV